jgi:hypothetical protein
MRLYTICINQRPVLVMSTGAEPPMPDALTTNTVLMKAYRDMRALEESLPTDVRRISDEREIDKALDSWLREDLQALEQDGTPLWNGDRASLHIREATDDEAQGWRASLSQAIDRGEEDAGTEDWLYLVPPGTRPT